MEFLDLNGVKTLWGRVKELTESGDTQIKELLDKGYMYAGEATPGTTHALRKQNANVFYLADKEGTYYQNDGAIDSQNMAVTVINKNNPHVTIIVEKNGVLSYSRTGIYSSAFTYTKAEVDEAIKNAFKINDAVVFKGLSNHEDDYFTANSIFNSDGVGDLPNKAGTDVQAGWMYKAANDGIRAGQVCKAGDMIICIKDHTAQGDLSTFTEEYWTVISSGNLSAYMTKDEIDAKLDNYYTQEDVVRLQNQINEKFKDYYTEDSMVSYVDRILDSYYTEDELKNKLSSFVDYDYLFNGSRILYHANILSKPDADSNISQDIPGAIPNGPNRYSSVGSIYIVTVRGQYAGWACETGDMLMQKEEYTGGVRFGSLRKYFQYIPGGNIAESVTNGWNYYTSLITNESRYYSFAEQNARIVISPDAQYREKAAIQFSAINKIGAGNNSNNVVFEDQTAKVFNDAILITTNHIEDTSDYGTFNAANIGYYVAVMPEKLYFMPKGADAAAFIEGDVNTNPVPVSDASLYKYTYQDGATGTRVRVFFTRKDTGEVEKFLVSEDKGELVVVNKVGLDNLLQ